MTVVSSVASYQNEAVVARFIRDYHKTPEQAEQCFDELKEFLAEVAVAANRIEPPSKDVDQMWHTFLLFTRDYAEFCKESFGKFIHHSPQAGGNCNADPAPGCDGDSWSYKEIPVSLREDSRLVVVGLLRALVCAMRSIR